MAAISFAGLCLPGSGLEQLGSNMVEFGWPSIVLGWTGVGCDHLRKALLGRKACLGWVWLG